MRVYFLSCIPAALKLNGLYLGTIDYFERHVELCPSDGVLAEIVPAGNAQPVNFFLDENFFRQPPDFADVYLAGGDAFVFIREYASKDMKLNVIFQNRFCGNLVTVFSQGGVNLSCEGAEYTLIPLPKQFTALTAEEQTLNGRKVLAIYGGKHLLIISEQGKVIFLNPVESAEFGATLSVASAFETCTAAYAECEFSYDGEKLALVSSRTVEKREPEKDIMHFAFFESVLTCGDFSKYLDDSLKQRADDLKSYLGDFVSVTVPPEKFYLTHGKISAAGLVYPKSGNLYEVKYYAVDITDGKISNIYPAE